MIEINEAITKGKQFVFQNYKSPDYKNAEDIILVSADKIRQIWFIQFRVPLTVAPVSGLQNVLGINKRIFYITVKINKTGEIIGVLDNETPKDQPRQAQIEPQTV
jgi:hypothetical protein